jgi:hypothetical protein
VEGHRKLGTCQPYSLEKSKAENCWREDGRVKAISAHCPSSPKSTEGSKKIGRGKEGCMLVKEGTIFTTTGNTCLQVNIQPW